MGVCHVEIIYPDCVPFAGRLAIFPSVKNEAISDLYSARLNVC